jgi:hypothetical protein
LDVENVISFLAVLYHFSVCSSRRSQVLSQYQTISFISSQITSLDVVRNLCNARGLTYEVIKYGSYNEEHYRHVLATSKFGIWVGRHESQGFAVQEALSMNVPLVVWDAPSMFCEMSGSHKQYGHMEGRYKLKSTAATTWDETCGLLADERTIGDCIGRMAVEYGKYGGREFIVRELSPAACMGRWLNFGGA